MSVEPDYGIYRNMVERDCGIPPIYAAKLPTRPYTGARPDDKDTTAVLLGRLFSRGNSGRRRPSDSIR